MAHQDIIPEEFVGSRHQLSLRLLQLKLPLCSAGGDEVAQHIVVARQIPLLHVLKPRHDVVAVAYQVGVVGSAQRRRQEGDHMDGVVKEFGETPELRPQFLGVPDQALLHEVRE